jgi:NADH-quinone oxidoreductase subunit E
VSNQAIDLDAILEKYPGQPQYLISLLQDIQAEYHYISPECLRLACDHVGVPLTRAWSVATFYHSFSLEPRGEHEIKVCQGTACHLKNSQRLVEGLEEALKVKAGHTTENLRFTLDTVNCLGACALSPVVMIDQEYLGQATTGALKRKIRQLEKAEGIES